MKNGDRFIVVETNEEVEFIKKDGIEFKFKRVCENLNGKKPYINFIGFCPLLDEDIIKKI